MANRTNDFASPIPLSQGGTGAIDASDARTNLGITIGARTVVGTVGQIDVSDGDGLLGNPTVSLAADTIIPGSGGTRNPVGTTLERSGMPTIGMFRGNSDLNQAEVYNGFYWQPLYSQVFGLTYTLTYSDLASAGQVILLNPPVSTASYRISNIYMDGVGPSFDGAGDRNIVITDGASEWTVLPAVALQALINAQWGTSEVPYPVSVGLSQASAPGDAIFAQYQGGTTDYIDGVLTLTIEYQQVS